MSSYQRRILLINRPFQLRFAFFGCLWLFALSVVYPLVIFSLFEFFLRYLERDPNGPPADFLINTRKEVLALLVIFQLIFMAVIFLINVFVSHRIAGPLHKLKNHFRQVKEGNLRERVVFRQKDHFPEVATEFNEMVNGLRSTGERAIRALDSALAMSESLRSAGAASEKIDSLQADLRSAKANIPQ
jgi:methyl-accepting chemotaxis protein